MIEYIWLLKTIQVVVSLLDIYTIVAVFSCLYATVVISDQNSILRERNAVLDNENRYLRLAFSEIASLSRGKDGILVKIKPKPVDETIN